MKRDPLLDSLLVRDGKPTSSVPPKRPGERHRSLEEMARELEASALPSAKPGPVKAWRLAANEPARTRFVAAVDQLDALGWSWERIGALLGCTKQHVMGLYHGSSCVPAYMLDTLDELPELNALPTRLRNRQLLRAV